MVMRVRRDGGAGAVPDTRDLVPFALFIQVSSGTASGASGEQSMKPREFGLCGCLGLAFTLLGCDAPNDIVPTTPPGAVIPRTPPDADNPAQAVGEAGVAATKATGETKNKPAPYTPAPPTAKGETKTTKNGVKYETLTAGTGEELKPGRVALFHYVGTLKDGTVFDSSRAKKQPARFTLGTGQLIRGWEEGMPGMRVGELRKLWIPAAQGYGSVGKGPVPPDADLVFEVELLQIFE
jgi:FKBP-type peptidyl-prolyl cis-trans isomerase